VEGCAEEDVAGNRLPFLLAQRAASEGPRWTRAVKGKLVTRLSGYIPIWMEEESRRRKMKRIGRVPTLVLCSRNARPEKGLVRRPHIDQHARPSKREDASKPSTRNFKVRYTDRKSGLCIVYGSV
jgi:hypothetical protein